MKNASEFDEYDSQLIIKKFDGYFDMLQYVKNNE